MIERIIYYVSLYEKGRGISIINARMKKKTSDLTDNLALVGRSQGFDKVDTIEVRTKRLISNINDNIINLAIKMHSVAVLLL